MFNQAYSNICARCGAWRGSLGLEPTPELYVQHLVQVFADVRRVLTDDGTLWLNLGDTYNAYNGNAGPSSSLSKGRQDQARPDLARGHGLLCKSLKPKDLVGIPWMVAFALRADGWYLRSDVVWSKPNPMPESVADRPTKSHEYLFLLAKSERYYYDADAIAEPAASADEARYDNGENGLHSGVSHAGSGSGTRKFKAGRSGNQARKIAVSGERSRTNTHMGSCVPWEGITRNRRSVWTVTTKPYTGAHFATFPMDLIEPCVLAGSEPGDTVLDPFNGSGTTGAVCQKWGRDYAGIELNPKYIDLSARRFAQPVLFPAGGAA